MNSDQKRYSIFNPKEKTAWDALDGNLKEDVINHFKKEVINGYTFSFDDNEYYINNKPYTYYDFHEKKRKISSL